MKFPFDTYFTWVSCFLVGQVDAALGAEEMVEQLTEKNLQLEEQIAEISEEKADLVSGLLMSQCIPDIVLVISMK